MRTDIWLTPFTKRKGFLELRSCARNLTCIGHPVTAEIVYWMDEKSCFTLAYWVMDREGFYLQFVGSRPLTYCDNCVDVFWKLVKKGQKKLDKYFQEIDV